MPYDPDPYRWQDHVVTPRRAAANLIATLVILAVGATLTLACTGNPTPTPPVIAHIAAAKHAQPLATLVRRTPQARATPGLL